MKKLWNKLPAWLRAILLNIVLLYPLIFINQGLLVGTNTQVGTQIGWALFAVIGVLAVFWFFAKKWNPFQEEGYIRLELKFNLLEWPTVASILGVLLIMFSVGNIGLEFISEEQSGQLQYIKSFAALSPLTGIPLLFALALHAGIVEEVIYRGYMQNTLNKYPRIITYLFIGILFSLAHLLPWQLILPYMLSSMAFSFIADKHKSISVAIFTHVLYDFTVFLLIYFNIFGGKIIEGFTLSILLNSAIAMAGVSLLLTKKRVAKVSMA